MSTPPNEWCKSVRCYTFPPVDKRGRLFCIVPHIEATPTEQEWTAAARQAALQEGYPLRGGGLPKCTTFEDIWVTTLDIRSDTC
jgi:hypothetical protein